MKTFKNFVVLTTKELEKIKRKSGKESSETTRKKVEELEASVKRKNKELERSREELSDLKDSTNRQILRLEEKIQVLTEAQDGARELVKQEIELANLKNILDARKDAYDANDAKMKDREAKLIQEEDVKDKSAYADGLADGLRKAHEITQEDRNNAMKIAMVSAASHTPTETMKELNSVHQLTTGSSKE